MYASQMQNFSEGQFLYGTGEEHTIRLLLKSNDSIANIPKLAAKNFWGSFYLGSKKQVVCKETYCHTFTSC